MDVGRNRDGAGRLDHRTVGDPRISRVGVVQAAVGTTERAARALGGRLDQVLDARNAENVDALNRAIGLHGDIGAPGHLRSMADPRPRAIIDGREIDRARHGKARLAAVLLLAGFRARHDVSRRNLVRHSQVAGEVGLEIAQRVDKATDQRGVGIDAVVEAQYVASIERKGGHVAEHVYDRIVVIVDRDLVWNHGFGFDRERTGSADDGVVRDVRVCPVGVAGDCHRTADAQLGGGIRTADRSRFEIVFGVRGNVQCARCGNCRTGGDAGGRLVEAVDESNRRRDAERTRGR